MRSVVRRQATLLGLGMVAGIVSATLGSLAEWAFHVSGFWVFTAMWGVATILLLKHRPDFLR